LLLREERSRYAADVGDYFGIVGKAQLRFADVHVVEGKLAEMGIRQRSGSQQTRGMVVEEV